MGRKYKKLQTWKMKNRGVVPKSEFPSILKQTIRALGEKSSTNLKSGFKACGIVPFDRNEVIKRLPEHNSIDPRVPLAEILMNTFKQTRYNDEKQTVPKRTMLKIEPGQSVSSEETLELMKVALESKNVKKETKDGSADTKSGEKPKIRKRQRALSVSKPSKKPKLLL